MAPPRGSSGLGSQTTQQAQARADGAEKSELFASTHSVPCRSTYQSSWRRGDGLDGLSRSQNTIKSKDFVERFVLALCANDVGLESSSQLLN